MGFVLRSSTFQFFSINCRKFFELCEPFMNSNRNNKRKRELCPFCRAEQMVAANLKRIDVGSIVPFLFSSHFSIIICGKVKRFHQTEHPQNCSVCAHSNWSILCPDRHLIEKKKRVIDQTAISRLKCYATYLRIRLFKRATKTEQNKRQGENEKSLNKFTSIDRLFTLSFFLSIL